ncbi:MAG: GDSL-type esterase/lipase family protein, partial [Sphingomicrobium sp.]
MRLRWIGWLAGSIAAGAAAQPNPSPFASEIAAFAQADQANPPKPCALLFVGSSSIRLWQSLAADMAPYRVINRGFGGSTIADVNLHFDRAVAPYRPKAIFFYAGENDLNGGKSPVEVRADFDRFLQRKARTLGATPVYFISLKPSKARFAQMGKQAQVNAAVRVLAKRRADLHF